MTRDEIVSADQSSGGMFAVIPSVVMRDPRLSMSARMLYGVITWKCNENAYCWASNRSLGEELGLSAKRISTLVSELEASGHIETEIIKDPDTKAVKVRYIYPVVKSSRGISDPILKNKDTPPPEIEHTSPCFRGDPPPKDEEDIYEKHKVKRKVKRKDSPYSPPEGDAPAKKRRRREPKAAPDWKPERFEGFWRMYPVKKSKQAAIRAWDSLHPDDRLLAVMGRALQRQLAGPEWQRKLREEGGQGIPYPATWLNGRRWEDEDRSGFSDTEEPMPPERFGWD